MPSLVKSVEYLEVDITAALEPVTTNLTKGQDEAQCSVFFSYANEGTITDRVNERGGRLEVIDNAGTAALKISQGLREDTEVSRFQVFVIEWEAGITVQQVDVTGFTGTSVNVTIADVTDQDNAFLMYAYEMTQTSSEDDWDCSHVQVGYNGASTTSVTLQRRHTDGTANGTLYVVEADSGQFIVEHIEIDVTTGSTVSQNATIAATVEADTFVIHSYEVNEPDDDMNEGAWVADLESNVLVRVTRGDASPTTKTVTSTHGLQIVECQNSEWDVQRNDALTLGSTTVTDTITAIDQLRSVISFLQHWSQPSSVGRSDGTNGNDIDDVAQGWDFSADNTVRTRRIGAAGGTTPIGSYEVIQFAEADLAGPLPIMLMAPIAPAERRL